ncbi:MAG: hypothetical protein QOK10_1155, partial [Pseudonocardiales bacterium]|nr:hypothetical protein [Pseudonocardiales bacterium]
MAGVRAPSLSIAGRYTLEQRQLESVK